MKTVNYKLKSSATQLTLLVTDVSGKQHTTIRQGHIYWGYYPSCYKVSTPDLEAITQWAIKDGMWISDSITVQIARIEITKSEMVDVEKDLGEFKYWFFKPKVSYWGMMCEEYEK